MTTTTDLYEHQFDRLQEQLRHVSDIDYYADRFADSDVDLDSVSSLEEFREIPFTNPEDLAKAQLESEGRGPFYRSDVNRVFMNPAGSDLVPVFFTDSDWDNLMDSVAGHLRRAGMEAGDCMLNCMGYTVFLAGMLYHDGTIEAGGAPIPAGPGDSEQAAMLAEQLDADGIMGFPSYLEKVCDQADVEMDLMVSAGEPVVYYPDRREELKQVMGDDATVVDLYGIADVGVAACECEHENGMHVDDEFVVAEVIDPETGDPVEPGESGELVLTHLDKEVQPAVRLRTGDVTKLVERDCPCGQTLTLPDGVFGRVDNRLKVKGVKVWPDAITPVLSQYPGLTGEFLMEISTSDEGVDQISLACEGSPVDDMDELRARIRNEVHVSPNEISFVAELDDDEQIVDRRDATLT